MRARTLAIWAATLALVGSFVYGITTSPADTPATYGSAKAKPTACGHGHSSCTPTPTTSSTSPPPSGHKLMVIIEENHSQTEAINQMPHLASWAATYGTATTYTA